MLGSRQRSRVGGALGPLFGACARKGIEHRVVPLVTRVLEHRLFRLLQGNPSGKGPRERGGVVDCELIAERIHVDTR